MPVIHDPPARGRPALLVVGDSHSAALHLAAQARGIDARLLYISGNFWHEGRIRFHPEQGLSAAYRPALQRQIRALNAEIGGSVFAPGVPVIGVFGYHLGRIAPLFARHGHTPEAEGAAAGIFVSRALVEAWLHHHRGALIRVARQAARVCRLVVVAPPVLRDDPVTRRLAGLITARLRAEGVSVFDPREDAAFGPAPLPGHLRTADGVHGTADYGAMVLDRLAALGLVPLPA
jgi:hypothetical protein